MAALVLPECLSDRLNIMAYLMEYSILHDGKVTTFFLLTPRPDLIKCKKLDRVDKGIAGKVRFDHGAATALCSSPIPLD